MDRKSCGDLLLSFIEESDEPGPLGHYVNFWAPIASDNLAADIARGRQLAKEAMAVAVSIGSHRPILLPMLDMQYRGDFTGLAIGFMSEVAEAARCGRMV